MNRRTEVNRANRAVKRVIKKVLGMGENTPRIENSARLSSIVDEPVYFLAILQELKLPCMSYISGERLTEEGAWALFDVAQTYTGRKQHFLSLMDKRRVSELMEAMTVKDLAYLIDYQKVAA